MQRLFCLLVARYMLSVNHLSLPVNRYPITHYPLVFSPKKTLLLLCLSLILFACAREELPPPTPIGPRQTPQPTQPAVNPTVPIAPTQPPPSSPYPPPEQQEVTPNPYPAPTETGYPAPSESAIGPAAELLAAEVVAVFPHDENAFTQGLLWHDGNLYESTGQYGQSTIREVDLETGTIKRLRELDPSYFAEGLALVGDRLIQITWKEGVAIVYDRDALEETDLFSYEGQGEGWGLCFDGMFLWMSNGTERLTRRDPETFAPLGEIVVTQQGQPIPRLNELECVNGRILANVWFTDQIKIIDPQTGYVTGSVNLVNLLSSEERAARAQGDVLNGIAYNPEEDLYYVTGKNWPKLFAVRFVPEK